MKTVIVTLLLCWGASAQTFVSYIASTGVVAIAGTTYAATIQQPATNALPILFPATPSIGASVYCSATCTATVSVSGATATNTDSSTSVVAPTQPSPTNVFKFFTNSNVGSGTALWTFVVQAGETFPIDMSNTKLPIPNGSAGTNSYNVTISVASFTGNLIISFFPIEIHP